MSEHSSNAHRFSSHALEQEYAEQERIWQELHERMVHPSTPVEERVRLREIEDRIIGRMVELEQQMEEDSSAAASEHERRSTIRSVGVPVREDLAGVFDANDSQFAEPELSIQEPFPGSSGIVRDFNAALAEEIERADVTSYTPEQLYAAESQLRGLMAEMCKSPQQLSIDGRASWMGIVTAWVAGMKHHGKVEEAGRAVEKWIREARDSFALVENERTHEPKLSIVLDRWDAIVRQLNGFMRLLQTDDEKSIRQGPQRSMLFKRTANRKKPPSPISGTAAGAYKKS